MAVTNSLRNGLSRVDQVRGSDTEMRIDLMKGNQMLKGSLKRGQDGLEKLSRSTTT
jgi:hypothetical protein